MAQQRKERKSQAVTSGFRCRKLMRFRRVPAQMADEVPDGSGAHSRQGSEGSGADSRQDLEGLFRQPNGCENYF